MGMTDKLMSLALALDGPGMLIVALIDSSFLSLPEVNDFLIVLLSMGNTWQRALYYVLMTTIGSIAGCLMLYSAGRRGGSPLLRRRFSERNIARAENLFARYGMMAVLVPSILPPPCPFKIFVLSAGVFRMNVLAFAASVGIGRSFRYTLWSFLALLFGAQLRDFMDQNLRLVGASIFVLFAFVFTWLALRYWRKARRTN